MRGCSTGTSVEGPESQEEASESLKGTIALAKDVLFCFFGVYSTIFSLFRKIIMSPGPQSSLVPHKISLGGSGYTHSYIIQFI
jgi:hypothetical protein